MGVPTAIVQIFKAAEDSLLLVYAEVVCGN
jgi:hypothetical protein